MDAWRVKGHVQLQEELSTGPSWTWLPSVCSHESLQQQQQVQPFTTQDPTANVCLFYLHYFHSRQCAESGNSTNIKKHCLPINFKWPFNLHVNVNCMKAHSTRRESERSHRETLCLRIIVSRKTNKKKLPTNSQI